MYDELERLVLINDYKLGGGAEQIFRTTKSVMEKHYEVYEFYGAKESKIASNPIEYIYSFKYYKSLLALLIRVKPAVIHLHNYYHLLSPSILQAIKKYKANAKDKPKVIFTAHDYHLVAPNSGLYFFRKKNQQWALTRYKTKVSDRFCKRIDHRGAIYSILKKLQWYLAYKILHLQKVIDIIISPSEFLKKVFVENDVGVKIVVVRNPLEFDITHLKTFTDKNKNVLNLISFGRIAPEKGIVELLNVLKLNSSLSFRIDIYGKGPLENYVIEFIKTHKLEHKVNYKGWLNNDELRRILPSYDAMVMSSLWYENAPLSIVEASLSGLRLITANYGGMKEFGEICKGAFYFEPTESKSFGIAVKRSLADIKNNKIISYRKDEDLLKMFSLQTYEDALKECYELVS